MKVWEWLGCIAASMFAFGVTVAWAVEQKVSARPAIAIASFVAVMVFCAWAAFQIGIRS